MPRLATSKKEQKNEQSDSQHASKNALPERKVRIASLFSGAGGLEIAACRTGKVKAIVSTDANATFLATLQKNMPAHFPGVLHSSIVADARELKGTTITELLGGAPDIVMGGPPCDDFTTSGRRRGINGDKGPLIFEFLRIVYELKPMCFIFENVPNLTRQFKHVFNDFIQKSEKIGYFVKFSILKACDFGAPTMRKRVIVVGWLDSRKNADFSFPEATHGGQLNSSGLFSNGMLIPFVTVGNVLIGLPDVNADEGVMYFNHTGRPHRPETISHLKSIPPGKQVMKSYRYRAPWDGLTQSLTAGVDYATKSYIHPTYHREMSVREYARIHCFNDTWEFCGNHHNGIKQVANSVPIPLGCAVVDSVFKIL